MEAWNHIVQFVQRPDFFWYHGYGLTTLWVVACTLAILAKRINLYLHAALFFIVDVLTIFLVGGAFYRYIGRFGQWQEWTLVKQLHIFGGILFIEFQELWLFCWLFSNIWGESQLCCQHQREVPSIRHSLSGSLISRESLLFWDGSWREVIPLILCMSVLPAQFF